MSIPIGSRVVAVRNADEKVVFSYGGGTYDGDFVPDQATGPEQAILNMLGLTNPRITLDAGGQVWGYQCWWLPEDRFEEWCAGREVKLVPLDPETQPEILPGDIEGIQEEAP